MFDRQHCRAMPKIITISGLLRQTQILCGSTCLIYIPCLRRRRRRLKNPSSAVRRDREVQTLGVIAKHDGIRVRAVAWRPLSHQGEEQKSRLLPDHGTLQTFPLPELYSLAHVGKLQPFWSHCLDCEAVFMYWASCFEDLELVTLIRILKNSHDNGEPISPSIRISWQ